MTAARGHAAALVYAVAMAILCVAFADRVKVFTTALAVTGAIAAVAACYAMISLEINPPPPEERMAAFKSAAADWGGFWNGLALLLLLLIERHL